MPPPPRWGRVGERGAIARRLARYRPAVSLLASIRAGPPARVRPGLGASGSVLLLIRSTINRHKFRRVPTNSDILPCFFRWLRGWPSALPMEERARPSARSRGAWTLTVDGGGDAGGLEPGLEGVTVRDAQGELGEDAGAVGLGPGKRFSHGFTRMDTGHG